MAGKMISELSDAITLQSTDLLPLARGTSTLKIAGSAVSASTIISDTPPTGVANGQLWFDSSSGITSIYYDSSWIDVGGGDSANSLNVVSSPTIDLSYNTSTGTLSADANYLLTLINTLSTNMQNIGNYPYLEYAWVTTPNVAGQTLADNVSAVATMTTKVNDYESAGDIGSGAGIVGSNTGLTLAANEFGLKSGTYHYEMSTHGYSTSTSNSTIIMSLIDITSNPDQIISRSNCPQDGGTGATVAVKSIGQFKVTTNTAFVIGLLAIGNITITSEAITSNQFTNSTANADQRTTIKLWKVG